MNNDWFSPWGKLSINFASGKDFGDMIEVRKERDRKSKKRKAKHIFVILGGKRNLKKKKLKSKIGFQEGR